MAGSTAPDNQKPRANDGASGHLAVQTSRDNEVYASGCQVVYPKSWTVQVGTYTCKFCGGTIIFRMVKDGRLEDGTRVPANRPIPIHVEGDSCSRSR